MRDILQFARTSGLDMLDTARAYGDSEALLGEARAPKHFKIVSKCPPLEGADSPGIQLVQYFEASLAHLRTDRIYGYLLHRAYDLLGENGSEIWQSLCDLQSRNKVSRIGVSAYAPQEVLELLRRFPLSMVQLPANVLTNWLYEGSFLRICRNAGVEIHVRSAFLQGFLLADPAEIVGHLSQWAPTLTRFRECAFDLGLSPLQAALSALLAHQDISKIVVGVESKSQLEEIVAAVGGEPIDPQNFKNLACKNPGIMDPRTWPC